MDDERRNEIINKYQKKALENSYIITVFLLSSNREKYIKQAVDSIINQSYSEFCLVILDNNSFDSTKQIIETYNDDRIFFIERESPLPGSNYQYAFTICNTQLMTVFHDDDIINKEYLSVMIRKMLSDESIVLLSPSANIINEKGDIIREPSNTPSRFKGDMYFGSFISKQRYRTQIWFPANMYRTNFYKKELFKKYDDAGPAADQFIALQSERYGGTIEVISDRLINYRVHLNQGATKCSGTMEMQLFKFLKSDKYYAEKIKKYRNIAYRYIASAYKGIAINYKNNHNAEVKDSLKMDRYMFKDMDLKMKAVLHFCNLSYYLFYLTIVPYAAYLRWKE